MDNTNIENTLEDLEFNLEDFDVEIMDLEGVETLPATAITSGSGGNSTCGSSSCSSCSSCCA